jgi:SEC-C motif-containing protein
MMRARYSAYALGEIDYLVRSIPLLDRKAFDRRGAKQWSQSAEWKGLDIRSITEKANGTRATIEFVATFVIEGEEHAHHEIASFQKVNERWFFLDGKAVEKETEE